jgi:CheY-like chemotaxis protein
MEKRSASLILLMADDDEDDCLLAKAAFDGARLTGEVRFLGNGEQLVEYLRNGGDYSDPAGAPRPDLILLDLNMPQMDGREALKIIKSDSRLNDIPVAILTTSREQRDVDFCMDLGACRFITKPVEFEDWIKILTELTSLC